MDQSDYLISNEEALLTAAHGDESAKQIVRDNFRNFIKKICGKHYQENKDLQLDFEELLLAGEIALNHAMGAYDNGNIPFAAFAQVVIERGIYSLIRTQRGPTNAMFRNAVSLDGYANEDDDSLQISDIVGVDDIFTAKKFDSTMLEHMPDLVSASLCKEEAAVIKLRIEGYTFAEISNLKNISRRSMDALIQSIREKCGSNFG